MSFEIKKIHDPKFFKENCMAAHSDHVAYANETEAEKKRAASGYYWMVSGNSIMREIIRRP